MEYTIRRNKQNKNIKISVKEDGSVLVTYPWWSNRKQAKLFLNQKKNWVEEKMIEVKAQKNDSLLRKGTREDYLRNKQAAYSLVKEKLDYFNKPYRFNYSRISIRNQKTRWGSCSEKGNLNFNWRIVWLKDELADYLVVHELCHLGQMNHSKKYWELVEKTIPNRKNISKKLRCL